MTVQLSSGIETMTTREDKEVAMALRLLDNAHKTLAMVDEAFIVKERGYEPRPMPTFRPEEISLGKILGTGGFGIVNEVSKFSLDEDHHDSCKDEPEDDQHKDDDEDLSPFFPPDTDVHYEITKARRLMEKRAVRNGICRYAIKRLHGDLTQLEKTRGMIDLAIEAKFLAVVWHPNIIKMRGMAEGPLVDAGFFIILDRLFGTLDQKINDWFKSHKQHSGGFLGLGKKKKELKQLMVERMTVAYDLAAAFFYLHENRLVYRDIKPENIGFDVRGDVKVFDFGLCKSLSKELKAREGYGYRLTGRAGSLPYMAPEVIKMETYDTKCDVYSFAVLLWEILCLRQAYKGLSPTDFVEKVVVRKERLAVPNTVPPLTRLMIPEAWDSDPRKRPDMKRVAILIRGDLNDMTTDDSVLHRTRHLHNRSDHSIDFRSGASVHSDGDL